MGYHSRAGCVVQLDDTCVRAGYTYAEMMRKAQDSKVPVRCISRPPLGRMYEIGYIDR